MLELYFLKKWPLSPENLNIDTTCKATKTLAIFLGWHSIRGFVASSLIRLKTINHTWTYQVGLNSHENFELKPLLNCSRILRLTSAATSISRYLLVWLVTFNLTLPSRLHEGVARKTFFSHLELAWGTIFNWPQGPFRERDSNSENPLVNFVQLCFMIQE